MQLVTGRRDRPKVHYAPIILAGVVLAGLLVAAKMAASRFTWWRDASFSGHVVAKEAHSRSTGEPVACDEALKQPGKCRFYLRIRQDEGTTTHEVVLKLFERARVGDLVTKGTGSYRWRCVAGSPRKLE